VETSSTDSASFTISLEIQFSFDIEEQASNSNRIVLPRWVLYGCGKI
jgi:hypothetical protein